MANQVAAILSGEDYQHIYSWLLMLELLMDSKKVDKVIVEDPDAGSVDDVTIHYKEEASLPHKFYQIKYHVDHREQYSSDTFTTTQTENSTSLLQKFYRSWQSLKKQYPNKQIELYLLSNWTWNSEDKLKSYVSGENNALKQDFFDESERSYIGKIRKKWQTHLGANEKDFKGFAKCLRFKIGFDCWDEVKSRVVERMENLRLKSDNTYLKVASGIVREWIISKQQEITRQVLEKTLKKHEFYIPEETKPSVAIYLTTIKDQKFNIEPDYIIDWRDYFEGSPDKRGHKLKNPEDWNKRLLPELENYAKQLNETTFRQIRARGLARLSAWIAFGYCFPEVANYVIEVDQQNKLWRTDAKPNEGFNLIVSNKNADPNGEVLTGTGNTVAVGISIRESLDNDVRAHLKTCNEKVTALLLIRPERELGINCFEGAKDVVAFVDKAKELIRSFVKHWNATCLLLYYCGPLSGACFLGHKLNAVCREIQVMEDQQPGYDYSFLLK